MIPLNLTFASHSLQFIVSHTNLRVSHARCEEYGNTVFWGQPEGEERLWNASFTLTYTVMRQVENSDVFPALLGLYKTLQ